VVGIHPYCLVIVIIIIVIVVILIRSVICIVIDIVVGFYNKTSIPQMTFFDSHPRIPDIQLVLHVH